MPLKLRTSPNTSLKIPLIRHIQFLCIKKGETLLSPLHLHGVTSYFTARHPTIEEYNNFTLFSATAVEIEWDAHYPSCLAQEDALLTTCGLSRDIPEEFRGRFVAGMHTNPCKSPQEYRDGNLENVLTAHIIVSIVGGQVSTWIQTTNPTDIAAKWGIGLKAARRTLKCKTQKGLQTVLNPSLRRGFQKNDLKLRYRRLQRDVFGDTLISRTKYKRGNKYSEVFITKFGWSRAFPNDKKGDAHKVLSLLF